MDDGSRDFKLWWLVLAIVVIMMVGGTLGYIIAASGIPKDFEADFAYGMLNTLFQFALVLVAILALGSWRKELQFVKKKERDSILITNKHSFFELARCLHEISETGIEKKELGDVPWAIEPPIFGISANCIHSVRSASELLENSMQELYSVVSLSSYINPNDHRVKTHAEAFESVGFLFKAVLNTEIRENGLIKAYFNYEGYDNIVSFRDFLITYCDINEERLNKEVFD